MKILIVLMLLCFNVNAKSRSLEFTQVETIINKHCRNETTFRSYKVPETANAIIHYYDCEKVTMRFMPHESGFLLDVFSADTTIFLPKQKAIYPNETITLLTLKGKEEVAALLSQTKSNYKQSKEYLAKQESIRRIKTGALEKEQQIEILRKQRLAELLQ